MADRLIQLIQRFQQHQGSLHPSPLFGPLTRQQWDDLHVIHCSHHLGFLIAKES